MIGGLERFFSWYGTVISRHPIIAIMACLAATTIGGLGLIRFYEEGDAASLVIPRHSQFRQNIDWLDENFPREVGVKFNRVNGVGVLFSPMQCRWCRVSSMKCFQVWKFESFCFK